MFVYCHTMRMVHLAEVLMEGIGNIVTRLGGQTTQQTSVKGSGQMEFFKHAC